MGDAASINEKEVKDHVETILRGHSMQSDLDQRSSEIDATNFIEIERRAHARIYLHAYQCKQTQLNAYEQARALFWMLPNTEKIKYLSAHKSNVWWDQIFDVSSKENQARIFNETCGIFVKSDDACFV